MSRKNIPALKKLSENLKELRLERGYTQNHVSFHSDIDLSLYQRYESAQPPDIRFSNLLRILDFYKIPLEKLTGKK